MKNKKPDLVVWNEDDGYYARSLTYPSNVSAPSFFVEKKELQNGRIEKMLDVFDAEKNELVEKYENLLNQYNESLLVWRAKISFEPIVGKIYYLYKINNQNVLSLIKPDEWNKYQEFLGAYQLTSENKWKKT